MGNIFLLSLSITRKYLVRDDFEKRFNKSINFMVDVPVYQFFMDTQIIDRFHMCIQ